MTVSEDDWTQLEAEQHSTGVVMRRLFPRSTQDIFLAVQQPSGRRMLVLRVPSSAAEAQVRRGALPSTRGLALQFVPADTGRRDLQVVLIADDRREVFNPLISDMAATAETEADPAEALHRAVERFEYWRQLLQSIADTGLSPEARRGLYGELTVLRDHFLPNLPAGEAVQTWTGPTGANQDFQTRSAAIEVKTGTATEPQSIVIANERQLDDTGAGQLLLAHLSLDERRGGAGETLPLIIDAIRAAVTSAESRSILDDRLARVGYLTSQRHLYEEPRYTIRKIQFWRVTGQFPRIVEADLRPGVGHCRYRISTTGLDQYRVSAEQVACIVKGEA
ncbi:PD-(D/E)XK motif protein [Phytohabitans sp. ZYX-F-186]|uniref:PD-(D/E)XK motif protein n=1 Tax=Phytohabitans maris TaxID=3071409 RepID=A0ABU0ZAW8_9ACTN|nr:PD-(D/E)XK motif protein [Phytohabitans sp. ZYX-F-186]MDQ7903516.1 PD-(D/E)XK motif protein [Phytohabitans sp. ZYX-F-186]